MPYHKLDVILHARSHLVSSHQLNEVLLTIMKRFQIHTPGGMHEKLHGNSSQAYNFAKALLKSHNSSIESLLTYADSYFEEVTARRAVLTTCRDISIVMATLVLLLNAVAMALHVRQWRSWKPVDLMFSFLFPTSVLYALLKASALSLHVRYEHTHVEGSAMPTSSLVVQEATSFMHTSFAIQIAVIAMLRLIAVRCPMSFKKVTHGKVLLTILGTWVASTIVTLAFSFTQYRNLHRKTVQHLLLSLHTGCYFVESIYLITAYAYIVYSLRQHRRHSRHTSQPTNNKTGNLCLAIAASFAISNIPRCIFILMDGENLIVGYVIEFGLAYICLGVDAVFFLWKAYIEGRERWKRRHSRFAKKRRRDGVVIDAHHASVDMNDSCNAPASENNKSVESSGDL